MPQTLLEVRTNNLEIASNFQSLNQIYINGSLEKIGILEKYRWACPDGYFYNMPQVDERLYTGINERKAQEQKAQEEEPDDSDEVQ